MKGRTSHMPSRNLVRQFAAKNYYHVYNRGVEKRSIFLDDNDYAVFLGLLKKYLTGENSNPNNRHPYTPLNGKVDLVAYCLMPNHFHLLLYQIDEGGITSLMRRVATGYVMYFNNRYERVGGLFQGRYKASLIQKDDYLQHVSRYIHLNPDDYKKWPYTSLAVYQGRKKSKWLNTSHVLEIFNNERQSFLDFMEDYEDTKKELSILKWQLANGAEL